MKFRCSTCAQWTESDEAPAACLRCGGVLARLPADAVGFVVTRWIQDDDPGDEDPSEVTRWTVVVEMPPVYLTRALREVVIECKVTF